MSRLNQNESQAAIQPFTVRWFYIAGLLLLFSLSRGIAIAHGFRYLSYEHAALWQLLDFDVLSNHLLRGLLHLHGQPPLFNALVGISLKLAHARYGELLLAVQLLLDLLAFLAIYMLLTMLRVNDLLAFCVTVALMLNPTTIGFEFDGLYTTLVASLHCFIALALVGFIQRRTVAWLSALSLFICILVLLRSSYQWTWIAVLFAILLICNVGRRTQVMAAAVVCLAASLLWPAKNYILYKHFTSSTWSPYSLAKHWMADRDKATIGQLAAEGKITTFSQDSDLPTALEHHWSVASTGFSELDDITKKTGGDPNWNSLAMLRMHDAELKDDSYLLKHEPRIYVISAFHGLVQYFEPSSDYLLLRGGESQAQFQKLASLNQITDTLCCNLPFSHGANAHKDETGSGSTGLLLKKICFGAVAGELIIVGFLFSLWNRNLWKQNEDRRLTCLLLALTVNYVFVLVCMVEVNENMRYRFETQHLVAIIVVIFLQQLWDRRKRAIETA